MLEMYLHERTLYYPLSPRVSLHSNVLCAWRPPSSSNANKVPQPQVRAPAVHLGIPPADLIERDAVCLLDRIAAVTRLDLIVLAARRHDVRHLRLRADR